MDNRGHTITEKEGGERKFGREEVVEIMGGVTLSQQRHWQSKRLLEGIFI